MDDDDFSRHSRTELWLYDLSLDPATRVAGALLIIMGSALGAMLGILLISADPSDVLGTIDNSEGTSDVDGLVISALLDNSSGGDPIEGVVVKILDMNRLEISQDTTDSGGRFSFDEIARHSSIILVEHPGNITVEILLIPGDHAQIPITLTPGSGLIEKDMRGESHLGESVFIGTFIAVITLLAGLAGIAGGFAAYSGDHYRRAWWLTFFGLFSRGMIFIGPLFILLGLGMIYLCRDQFTDYNPVTD
jgi:hypothetical protein